MMQSHTPPLPGQDWASGPHSTPAWPLHTKIRPCTVLHVQSILQSYGLQAAHRIHGEPHGPDNMVLGSSLWAGGLSTPIVREGVGLFLIDLNEYRQNTNKSVKANSFALSGGDGSDFDPREILLKNKWSNIA